MVIDLGFLTRGSCWLLECSKVECEQTRAYDIRMYFELSVLRRLQGRRNEEHVILVKGFNHNVANIQQVVFRSTILINIR